MTAEDILRKNGYTEDEIKAIDPRIMTGIAHIITEAASLEQAAQARAAEAAEIERRYNHMYHTEIVPALNQWGTDKANKDAAIDLLTRERDFYKRQNEGARSAGFIPQDASQYSSPTSTAGSSNDQPRSTDGRYVAGGNPVPGSPGWADHVIRGISNASWAEHKYQRLYGEPLPEDYNFDDAYKEASSQGMDFREYLGRKFKFAERERELAEKKQKDHDEAIRKETRSLVEKEYAERGGSNPNIRAASPSQFSRVRKAVETGKMKDPLMMNAEARRQQTNQQIHAEIAERESQGNA